MYVDNNMFLTDLARIKLRKVFDEYNVGHVELVEIIDDVVLDEDEVVCRKILYFDGEEYVEGYQEGSFSVKAILLNDGTLLAYENTPIVGLININGEYRNIVADMFGTLWYLNEDGEARYIAIPICLKCNKLEHRDISTMKWILRDYGFQYIIDLENNTFMVKNFEEDFAVITNIG